MIVQLSRAKLLNNRWYDCPKVTGTVVQQWLVLLFNSCLQDCSLVLAWLFNSHWHGCSTVTGTCSKVAGTTVQQSLAWLFRRYWQNCFKSLAWLCNSHWHVCSRILLMAASDFKYLLKKALICVLFCSFLIFTKRKLILVLI